jgi:hypothetical protein
MKGLNITITQIHKKDKHKSHDWFCKYFYHKLKHGIAHSISRNTGNIVLSINIKSPAIYIIPQGFSAMLFFKNAAFYIYQ